MKRYKAARRVYIGRRSDGGYELGLFKKNWGPSMGFANGYLDSFCSDDFETTTGIKLKSGELVRVTINIEAVK